MPKHALTGCRPTPLSSYLKALGIFRLVAEQADHEATMRWEAAKPVMNTKLDERALESFFLEHYQPTPIVSPWSGGSGFHPGYSNEALVSISSGKCERLAAYRAAIERCERQPMQKQFVSMRVEMKALKKKKKRTENEKARLKVLQKEVAALKDDLVLSARNQLTGKPLRWFDAALQLTAQGVAYPPLLGTGGNDGNMDFSNNFMQRLIDLFDPDTGSPNDGSQDALANALWGNTATVAEQAKLGQFDPGGAGGPNAGIGFDSDSSINVWDYVLTMEGALLFAGSITRRSVADSKGALSFPFSVRASSAGYGSASEQDGKSSRGELWMPFWEKPTCLPELMYLFAEGRATVSRRPARRGVDFARALAAYGVDRGLVAFERYGLFERNGRAYLATPIGRWKVSPQPRIELLDDIDAWLERFRREADGDHSPASFTRTLKTIEAAVMALCQRAAPRTWQQLLMVLGDAEAVMTKSPQTTAEAAEKRGLRPLPVLRRAWEQAADDGSAEFRLACSLASIRPVWVKQEQVLPDLRGHMVPLDPSRRDPAFDTKAMNNHAMVWGPGDLAANLLRVLSWRLTTARKHGMAFAPLSGNRAAPPVDIAAFIDGRVDETRTAALTRGLAAVDWKQRDIATKGKRPDDAALPAPYSLLRLAHLSWPPPGSIEGLERLPFDGSVIRTAASGRMDQAVAAAARRLRAVGVQPLISGDISVPPRLARRIAAALLFPVDGRTARRMAKDVTRSGRRPATAASDRQEPTAEVV